MKSSCILMLWPASIITKWNLCSAAIMSISETICTLTPQQCVNQVRIGFAGQVKFFKVIWNQLQLGCYSGPCQHCKIGINQSEKFVPPQLWKCSWPAEWVMFSDNKMQSSCDLITLSAGIVACNMEKFVLSIFKLVTITKNCQASIRRAHKY